MKLTPITVTAFEITGVQALDPIRVILHDTGPGRGRIIIECFGTSWSAYWGSMGISHTVATFFATGTTDYLANALQPYLYKTDKDKEKYLLRVVQAVQEALKGTA